MHRLPPWIATDAVKETLRNAGGPDALDIGKAGEHLVCADLLLTGYQAYLTDQGLRYDVLLDTGGRLLRIQVKSTCGLKEISSQERKPLLGYTFAARTRGKGNSARLTNEDCDMLAFVALDIRCIAYIPVYQCGETVQLGAPGQTVKGKSARVVGGRRGRANIDHFPPQHAINRILWGEDNFAQAVEFERQMLMGETPLPEGWEIARPSAAEYELGLDVAAIDRRFVGEI